MKKYQWILFIALIGMAFTIIACEYAQDIIYTDPPEEMVTEPETTEPETTTPIEPGMMADMKDPDGVVPTPEPETPEMMATVDVLIYTNKSFWITLEDAEMAAEITRAELDAAGISVMVTKDDAFVRNWMQQTTGDGNVNVIVLYGVLPAAVYGTGNTQPDGSIAENWIETTDGDTILNHADYIAYNTDFDVDKVQEWTPTEEVLAVGSNKENGLRNLMDNPTIDLFAPVPIPDRPSELRGGPIPMIVTSEGTELTPSLSGFNSYRSIPLNQLQGDWFAEKVFASDTSNAQAEYADPVIVRDGNLGRLAIIHATANYEGLLNGEVAAEIIINFLYAE